MLRDSRDYVPQRLSINRKLTWAMVMSITVLLCTKSLESLTWSGPQILAGRCTVTPHPSPTDQAEQYAPYRTPSHLCSCSFCLAPSSVTNVFCRIHTHDRHRAQSPLQLSASLSSPNSLLLIRRHSQCILLFPDNQFRGQDKYY